MHYLHLLAVESDTAEEAIHKAESFVAPYEGAAYDWFMVGGRWENMLSGKNVMCAVDDVTEFMAAVELANSWTVGKIRELVEQLTGRLGPGLTPEEMAEQGVNPKKYRESRQRTETIRQASAKEFNEMIADPSPLATRYGMTGWRLRQLGSLVAGYFTSNTMFYDAEYDSSDVTNLRERVIESPATQWLVVLDMHN